MFEGFSFSFENDFQKLSVEAKLCDGRLLYSVAESVNVDFIPSFDGFKPFSGDSSEWVDAFCNLDFPSWGSCCDASASTGLPHWSLSVRNSFAVPSQSSNGCDGALPVASPKVFSGDMDSYPADFVDFLDLLKDLLGVPVLLLEL